LPCQQGRIPPFDFLAHFLRQQRPARFHQYHAAGPGESRLSGVRTVINEFQQFIANHVITEQICQPQNCLLDGANSFDDLRPLI
jgi:hypothetical protein